MIRRPPRSTLFPTRRSSDLRAAVGRAGLAADDGHLRRRGEDGPALRQLPAEPRGVKELLARVLGAADLLLLRVEEVEGRGRAALRLRLDGLQQMEEVRVGDDAAV